jgi:hypothetical protein
MSWKASLLGAVLVVAAGLAVGVAIGGKTATRTITVTVVRKVKAPAPAPTTTTTAATTTPTAPTTTPNTSASTATPPSNPANQEQFLDSYLESQGGAETLNHDAENASLDPNPSQQELAGQTYQHAVAFDLDASGEGATASYQIPSPGFTRLASSAVGLDTTSNARATYRLTVYKNDDSSPNSVVLYQGTFHGPSAVHRMSFATQGATDLLFVWTHKASEPEAQDTFILADPVLTGGS